MRLKVGTSISSLHHSVCLVPEKTHHEHRRLTETRCQTLRCGCNILRVTLCASMVTLDQSRSTRNLEPCWVLRSTYEKMVETPAYIESSKSLLLIHRVSCEVGPSSRRNGISECSQATPSIAFESQGRISSNSARFWKSKIKNASADDGMYHTWAHIRGRGFGNESDASEAVSDRLMLSC